MRNKIKEVTKEQAEEIGLIAGVGALIDMIAHVLDLTEKSKKELKERALEKVLEKRKKQ